MHVLAFSFERLGLLFSPHSSLLIFPLIIYTHTLFHTHITKKSNGAFSAHSTQRAPFFHFLLPFLYISLLSLPFLFYKLNQWSLVNPTVGLDSTIWSVGWDNGRPRLEAARVPIFNLAYIMRPILPC